WFEDCLRFRCSPVRPDYISVDMGMICGSLLGVPHFSPCPGVVQRGGRCPSRKENPPSTGQRAQPHRPSAVLDRNCASICVRDPTVSLRDRQVWIDRGGAGRGGTGFLRKAIRIQSYQSDSTTIASLS